MVRVWTSVGQVGFFLSPLAFDSVFEQDTVATFSIGYYPESGGSVFYYMTEKLMTGLLNHKQNKLQCNPVSMLTIQTGQESKI